ncbi:MAG: hypothetical protein Q7R76_03660 [Candidatus Woesearchaeota archaeon]|nr:hypothetical protein [Candidatus Woesearchaeota archaeon]
MPKQRGVVQLQGEEILIYGKGKKYEVGQKPRFQLKPKMDVMFEVRTGTAVNINQVPKMPGHRQRKYE